MPVNAGVINISQVSILVKRSTSLAAIKQNFEASISSLISWIQRFG
jgi:hypothetical protein